MFVKPIGLPELSFNDVAIGGLGDQFLGNREARLILTRRLGKIDKLDRTLSEGFTLIKELVNQLPAFQLFGPLKTIAHCIKIKNTRIQNWIQVFNSNYKIALLCLESIVLTIDISH